MQGIGFFSGTPTSRLHAGMAGNRVHFLTFYDAHGVLFLFLGLFFYVINISKYILMRAIDHYSGGNSGLDTWYAWWSDITGAKKPILSSGHDNDQGHKDIQKDKYKDNEKGNEKGKTSIDHHSGGKEWDGHLSRLPSLTCPWPWPLYVGITVGKH